MMPRTLFFEPLLPDRLHRCGDATLSRVCDTWKLETGPRPRGRAGKPSARLIGIASACSAPRALVRSDSPREARCGRGRPVRPHRMPPPRRAGGEGAAHARSWPSTGARAQLSTGVCRCLLEDGGRPRAKRAHLSCLVARAASPHSLALRPLRGPRPGPRRSAAHDVMWLRQTCGGGGFR